MTFVTVIKSGPGQNQTLAGIEHGVWGEQIRQPVIFCQDWQEGFDLALQSNYKHALFVKSGTLFVDWKKWVDILSNYPHQGLIGHVIYHPGQEPYIDDQCWFVDLTKFFREDLSGSSGHHAVAVRSSENLHDDYTPLWLRSGKGTQSYAGDKFGQGLIARQLNSRLIVSNWSRPARDIKYFCYPGMDLKSLVREKFSSYLDLAETQLWVFNNEPIRTYKRERLVGPGSGLFWMLNIIDPRVKEIQIIDISHIQIKFCQHLWQNWNGKDYGNFVWAFIAENQLIHYELDQADLSPLERLKLKSPSRFVAYVNQRFNDIMCEHAVADFSTAWQQSKNKKLNINTGNLVHWLLDHPEDRDNLWMSNILDYKWTKLNTTWEKCQQFRDLLNET